MSTTTSYAELINQMTAELQNISNYIGTLSGNQINSHENRELMVAIKEHLEVSWMVQTQLCAVAIPQLTREPAPHHGARPTEGLMADAVWPGHNPYWSSMDIEEEEEEEDLPPQCNLERQMTNNNLNTCHPDAARQNNSYRMSPLHRWHGQGFDDRPPTMQREDSALTSLARELMNDSIPPMPPTLARLSSACPPPFSSQEYPIT